MLERLRSWMQRHRGATAVGLAICLMSACWLLLGRGCGGCRPAPRELTIFLTADTRGHMEPCGCTAYQWGGLPVRATLVERAPAINRLLVDAGNVTYGNRKYDLIKFHYILSGMEEMRYDAVNLGATEVMLNEDDLLAMVRRHRRLTFISCNVLDAHAGRPIVEPYTVKNVHGFRVGMLGVVRNDLEIVGKGLRVVPPIEALNEWVPRVARRCDYLIVVAFVDQDAIQAIVDRFYEVDAVLGGDVAESSRFPEKINRAMVFSVTDKGKVLGKVILRRAPDGSLRAATGETLKVESTLPRDPRILKIADAFKEELRSRQIELAEIDEHLEPIATDEGAVPDRYAGAETCRNCHKLAYSRWKNSAHFRTFEVLKPRRNQYDPDCLICHSVGYRSRDGFRSEEQTPQFAMVQCESCHGRGWNHVQAMERHEKMPYSTLRVVTPNTCIRCHDRENSPTYEFATYWPRIAHRTAHTR